MQTIEEFKKERADLVELWSGMSKEELYEEIFKEAVDAVNMEERVQLFMNECTNLSKTTYTLESLKTLINEQKEVDINDYCYWVCDDTTDEDILEEIKNRAKEANKYQKNSSTQH